MDLSSLKIGWQGWPENDPHLAGYTSFTSHIRNPRDDVVIHKQLLAKAHLQGRQKPGKERKGKDAEGKSHVAGWGASRHQDWGEFSKVSRCSVESPAHAFQPFSILSLSGFPSRIVRR